MSFDFVKDELKQYTPKDFINNWACKASALAAALTLVLALGCSFFFGVTDYAPALSAILPISIQVSVVMTAITTAGFIMLAGAGWDDKFILFLKDKNLYNAVFFLFAEPAGWGALNIIFGAVTLSAVKFFPGVNTVAGIPLLTIAIGLFIYVVLGYLNLYSTYQMYGTERLNYLSNLRAEEEMKKDGQADSP